MFVPYVKVNKFSKEANFRFHIIKNKKKKSINWTDTKQDTPDNFGVSQGAITEFYTLNS